MLAYPEPPESGSAAPATLLPPALPQSEQLVEVEAAPASLEFRLHAVCGDSKPERRLLSLLLFGGA